MPCPYTASPSHFGTIETIVWAGSEPAPTRQNPTSGCWLDPPSTVFPTIRAQHRCAPTSQCTPYVGARRAVPQHHPPSHVGTIEQLYGRVPNPPLHGEIQHSDGGWTRHLRSSQPSGHSIAVPLHSNASPYVGARHAVPPHPIEQHRRNKTAPARHILPLHRITITHRYDSINCTGGF
jgi:hypothetical protein